MNLSCKKINYKIITFFIFYTCFSLVIFSPVLAVEDRTKDLGGLKDTAGESGYNTGDLAGEKETKDQIAVIVGKTIGVVLSLLGVIFFILVFMGAFNIIGANGNEEIVKQGKERIKKGFSGMFFLLVAYLLAQVIIFFVTKGGEINL